MIQNQMKKKTQRFTYSKNTHLFRKVLIKKPEKEKIKFKMMDLCGGFFCSSKI